jgi:hypothetical protein
MSCYEVHPVVYCIMHLASIQDHERTLNLTTSGEPYTEGGNTTSQKKGKGVTVKKRM